MHCLARTLFEFEFDCPDRTFICLNTKSIVTLHFPVDISLIGVYFYHSLLFLSLFVFMVAILFRLVETLTKALSDNNQRDNNAVELVALLSRERMADMVI